MKFGPEAREAEAWAFSSRPKADVKPETGIFTSIKMIFMPIRKAGKVVSRTSFEEEQQIKDEAFLKLKPAERLRIHEQLRKRIWGDRYDKLSLKGLKVVKKTFYS